MEKKALSYLILFSILLYSLNVFAVPQFSQDVESNLKEAIILYIGSPKAYVNLKELAVDSSNREVYPITKDGRTLVPIRFISENFGGIVDWDSTTSTATIKIKDTKIVIKRNSKTMTVNNKEVFLDVPAMLIEGKTFLPLRALVEALNKEVFYHEGLIIISDTKDIFSVNKDITKINEVISLFNKSIINPNQSIVPNVPKGDSKDFINKDIPNRLGNTMSNIANAGFVAQDGEWNYYIFNDHMAFQIYKVKSDGSDNQLFHNEMSYNINIDDNWIYFTTVLEKHIYKMKKDGTDKTRITNERAGLNILLGDWIYYINKDDNDTIYQIKTDGTQSKKISNDSVHTFSYSNGWFYFADFMGPINKMRIDGSDKEVLTASSGVVRLIVNGDWIYYLEDSPGNVYKIKTDGSEKTLLFKDKAYDIAINGDWIYFSNSSAMYANGNMHLFVNGGPIYKMKLDGSEMIKINDRMSRITGITDEWVYINEMHYKNGTYTSILYRISLDGSIEEKMSLE